MTDPAPLLAAAFGLRAPATVEATARLFRARTVARRETLFFQDDTCERCWLVLDGALALRAVAPDGQPLQLASYGPGEFVGAYPAPRRQDGELVATMRSAALEAGAVALARLAGDEPELGAGLAALLARQHDSLIARLSRQIGLSAVARVYAELLERADGDGRIQPPPVLTALALKVNTTRETASRAVAAAERRGLLVREAGALRIVSRERFEALLY